MLDRNVAAHRRTQVLLEKLSPSYLTQATNTSLRAQWFIWQHQILKTLAMFFMHYFVIMLMSFNTISIMLLLHSWRYILEVFLTQFDIWEYVITPKNIIIAILQYTLLGNHGMIFDNIINTNMNKDEQSLCCIKPTIGVLHPQLYGEMSKCKFKSTRHGPLTRYVKLWVVHAPGMPGTFSPSPTSK